MNSLLVIPMSLSCSPLIENEERKLSSPGLCHELLVARIALKHIKDTIPS